MVRRLGKFGLRQHCSLCPSERHRATTQVDRLQHHTLAIYSFAARQVECDWSPKCISRSVKLTGEPALRSAKSASMSSAFPRVSEAWTRTEVLSILYGRCPPRPRSASRQWSFRPRPPSIAGIDGGECSSRHIWAARRVSERRSGDVKGYR